MKRIDRHPGSLLRVLFKLPLWLYRWRLGWLLGHRFVRLTHRGRTSSRLYQTVLEVVRYDPTTDETVVVSGYGPQADWYRNLQAQPAVRVETGRTRYAPIQRFLTPAEVYREMHDYQRRHPWAARLLLRWLVGLLGLPYMGQMARLQALAERLPMFAFRPRRCVSAADGASAQGGSACES